MHKLLTKSNKLTDTFLFLTAGTLFTFGITASILSCTEFLPDYKLLLLYTFIVMLLLRVITLNKYILIAVLIISFMTCAFVFYDMKTSSYLSELYDKVKHSITMLSRYITGFVTYKAQYGAIITWIILAVVSIFTAVFVLLSFKFYVLFTVAAIIISVCLFSGDFDYNLSFYACIVSMFIFLTKYLCSRNMNDNEKQSKLKINKRIFGIISIYSIPIVFICLAIAYILPKPQNKEAMQTLNAIIKKPFDNVSDFLYPYFSPKYYSLKNTGFMNKNNKLGGDVTLNDRVVMEVDVAGISNERLFLAGAYKDKYTGYSWENSEPDFKTYEMYNNYTVDLLELSFSNLMISYNTGEFDLIPVIFENSELITNSIYAGRCEYKSNGTFTVEMQLSVYKPQIMTITMKDAKTYSIFTPYMTTSVTNLENDMQLKKSITDNIISNDLINTNDPYNITYRTKPSVNYWGSIVSYSRKGIYNEIYEKMLSLHKKYNFDKNQLSVNLDEQLDNDPANLHMMNIYPEGEDYFDPDRSICYEDFLIDVLMPRALEIYERYTVLPKHLPKRVIELSQDITNSTESLYLKALLIKGFLRNIPYTLSPGKVPDNRDFVDYFLFDGKKGYCVYYASAFVVMCRAVGIPARYVEGYVTPSERSENGTYIVTNKQAHAWAEIYLEGYGWVTIDPTSSTWYNEAESNLLAYSEDYQDESDIIIEYERIETIKEDISDANMSNEEILTEDILKEGVLTKEIQDEGMLNEEIKEKHNLNEAILKRIEKPSVLIIYRLTTSIILLLLLLFTVISIRYYLKKIAMIKKIKISNNEAVRQYYLVLKDYLKLYGFLQLELETSMEFAERLKDEPNLCGNNIDFYAITEIFSKAYYGGKQISEVETSVLKNAVRNIQKLMLIRFGRVKYIYYKYIKISV